MIRTVSDLLEAFLEKEVARLDSLKITHDAIAENAPDRAALEADIRFLEEFGLAGRDLIKPSVCRLLTSACQTGILPDGRFFAGENVSGRVARWTLKQLPRAKRTVSGP